MKVALIMFYDDTIKSYGDINYNINKLYCEKHNLEIILSHERKYNNTSRCVTWERIPALLDNISKFDYLIWIDSDAFFYNDANNITDLINKYNDVNFIFSRDNGNIDINSGVFIVKNSQYSIDFLTKWGYDDDLFNRHPSFNWWEQNVLILMFNENILNIRENSIILDFGVLQHFNKHDRIDNISYICHLAGKDKDIRDKVAKNYFNKITSNSIVYINKNCS